MIGCSVQNFFLNMSGVVTPSPYSPETGGMTAGTLEVRVVVMTAGTLEVRVVVMTAGTLEVRVVVMNDCRQSRVFSLVYFPIFNNLPIFNLMNQDSDDIFNDIDP